MSQNGNGIYIYGFMLQVHRKELFVFMSETLGSFVNDVTHNSALFYPY